jgi:hypothetical protein
MSLKGPPENGDDGTSASDATDPPKASFGWDRDLERLLEDWRTRAWAAQIGHYRVASRLRTYNLWLGLPVVIFTTAVGTSLFATLNEDRLDTWLRVVVGGISLLAAIFAGIQTFLNFAQRADQHVVAADWYASIRRKIEQQVYTPRNGRTDPRRFLNEVRQDMNNVGSQSPEIGERVWGQVAAEFGLQHPGVEPEPTVGTIGQYAPKHAGP